MAIIEKMNLKLFPGKKNLDMISRDNKIEPKNIKVFSFYFYVKNKNNALYAVLTHDKPVKLFGS